MLGKLMKYEWKATWKILVPMDVFIIVMSLLVYITIELSFFHSDNALVEATGVIVIMTYIITLFITAVGTMIYLIYRAYTSIYGDEGYLLHTLPVDKHHIIISKVVVSTLWIMMNLFLIYFSAAALLSTQKWFLESIVDAFRFWAQMRNFFHEVKGFAVFMTLVAAFISMVARILKIAACISLGQLAPNHKVLSSFGFYYGIYFIQRMFSFFYFLIMGMMTDIITDGDNWFMLSGNWPFSLISGLIYCAIFYFVTWYIMEKKLSLD